jgi:AcrR family transcriptional regulator
MCAAVRTGRSHQKERTRTAIVAATRELIRSGRAVTMPAVAAAARVSEATAYRYFPDLISLLREADTGLWPRPADALAPLARSGDPVERVAYAAEVLLRGVQAYQGAVRAMIAATITQPAAAAARPGYRFGLIEEALAPVDGTRGTTDPAGLAQLKRDLAVIISAEALFVLTDLCGLAADEAIASIVQTARTVTQAMLQPGQQRLSGQRTAERTAPATRRRGPQ